jgi:outer membrane protein assembly factor BamB
MPRIPGPTTLTIAFVLAGVTSLGVHGQGATSQGWTQFRGPNATGIAVVTKAPPIEFGPGRNMLWKTFLPPGHSSPVIWGDRLFLTAFDADHQRLLTLGLDRTTGKELWRQEVAYGELGPIHQVSTAATATPVVDGERVYVYFAQVGLLAYDLNGKAVWNLPLPFATVRYGSGTSPILAGDRLLLNRETTSDPFIIAVDRRSGKELWKTPHSVPAGAITNSGWATPVVVGNQVIVHRPGKIESYEIATGAIRWWVNASGGGTSTPAVVGDMVYVGTWSALGEDEQRGTLPDFATALREHDQDKSGTISREEAAASGIVVATRPDVPDLPGATFGVPFNTFDTDKNGELTSSEWANLLETARTLSIDHGLLAVRTDGKGDVTASHVAWRENRSIPEVPSPIVWKDRVYLVRNGGVLSCLDVKTGKVLYRSRIGAPGPYFSSPVEAGGRLYVGSGEGLLVVVAPGDTPTVLARNDIGEPIFATPAVSPEGILYVRTPSTLYAFGTH